MAWDGADTGLQERIVQVQRFARGGSPLGQPVGIGGFRNTAEGRPRYQRAVHPTGQFTVAWVEQPVVTSKVLKARSFQVP